MDGHPLRPEIVRSKERSLPKGGSSLLSISVSSDSSMGLCWDAYLFFHRLLRSCAGNRVKIRPPKQSHSAAQHITDAVSSVQP